MAVKDINTDWFDTRDSYKNISILDDFTKDTPDNEGLDNFGEGGKNIRNQYSTIIDGISPASVSQTDGCISTSDYFASQRMADEFEFNRERLSSGKSVRIRPGQSVSSVQESFKDAIIAPYLDSRGVHRVIYMIGEYIGIISSYNGDDWGTYIDNFDIVAPVANNFDLEAWQEMLKNNFIKNTFACLLDETNTFSSVINCQNEGFSSNYKRFEGSRVPIGSASEECITAEQMAQIQNIQVAYDEKNDQLAVILVIANGIYVRAINNALIKEVEKTVGTDDADRVLAAFNSHIMLTKDSDNKPVLVAGEPPSEDYEDYYVTNPDSNVNQEISSIYQPAAYFDAKGFLRLFYFDSDKNIWGATLLAPQFTPSLQGKD